MRHAHSNCIKKLSIQQYIPNQINLFFFFATKFSIMATRIVFKSSIKMIINAFVDCLEMIKALIQ